MTRLQEATPKSDVQTGYAPVNGLQMYYEIHGSGGIPVVLLHGWFSALEIDFGPVLPLLARTRQVIGVEWQGHGRTADIDRPYRYEQLADDMATLLDELGIAQADFFGYSGGSGISIEVGLRHPERARKLVLAGGTSYSLEGLHPELSMGGEALTPEVQAAALQGSIFQETYARLAPNPDDWMTLVTKKLEHDAKWQGWSEEAIASLQMPVLLIIGDSDIVRPEHTVEMFRLLGGGVPGDLTGLPRAQLAILPGTTHLTLVQKADWLAGMIEAFLDAPVQ
jgi:pimeloyl-ACP methyl ester carboxylesterase